MIMNNMDLITQIDTSFEACGPSVMLELASVLVKALDNYDLDSDAQPFAQLVLDDIECYQDDMCKQWSAEIQKIQHASNDEIAAMREYANYPFR